MAEPEDAAPPATASPTAMAQVTGNDYPLDFAAGEHNNALLARMLRDMFPYSRFDNGPYHRSAGEILEAAGATPALKIAFATTLHDLLTADSADLEEAAAFKHLKTIETTEFFKLVRSTAIVTLYNDPETWEALGYGEPGFDKGGYIDRDFNDLDWLPEPPIEVWEGGLTRLCRTLLSSDVPLPIATGYLHRDACDIAGRYGKDHCFFFIDDPDGNRIGVLERSWRFENL